jgi:adenosylcobinamide amidohydrolase
VHDPSRQAAPLAQETVGGWSVRRFRRWLLVDLARTHRTLGWTIVGGGLARARRVAWLGVRDDDLPADLDPRRVVCDALAADGLATDVEEGAERPVFLTSSDLGAYVDVLAEVDACGGIAGAAARCVATVGLGNAARVGSGPGTLERARTRLGTINILCGVSRPLGDAALVEALSIVSAARTTAVLEAGMPIGDGGAPATGTGTDCCVIAAPEPCSRDAEVVDYAGLHTPTGVAIGRAVLTAVARGVAAWRAAAGRTGLG